MIEKIAKILEIVEEGDNNNWSIDDNSLQKRNVDKTALARAKERDLIHWTGTNYTLTEKGEQFLLDHKKSVNIKKGIIFDTNIFDKICEGKLTIQEVENSRSKGFEYFITHIQSDEISKCDDYEKRSKLILFLTSIRPIVIETESSVFGTSRLGFSRLGDGKVFENIKNKNLKKIPDSLIGEVAIKKNLILVTEDKTLRKKINSLGGKAISLEKFKELIA